MATPKRLDSTSPADVNSEDDSPPTSFSISVRRSQRKRSVSDAVIDKIGTNTNKKKKKLASKVIWTEEDVLALLKGLVEYRAKKVLGSKIDWDEFFGFVKGSIVAKVSKTNVMSKIRKLKKKFLVQYEKNNGRSCDPCFTKVSDSEAFGFSLLLWGKNGTQNETGGKIVEKDANAIMPLNENEEIVTAGKASMENQEVANFESLNEKEAAKIGFDGIQENVVAGKDSIDADEFCVVQEELFKDNDEVSNGETLKQKDEAAKTDKPQLEEIVVDEIPENVIVVKDISYVDIVADELLAIQDAFESMISQGLSDYQKKMQLENLMNIGAGKRRELSKEWKELCVEIAQLNIKKLKFTAKLAEAAATDS